MLGMVRLRRGSKAPCLGLGSFPSQGHGCGFALTPCFAWGGVLVSSGLGKLLTNACDCSQPQLTPCGVGLFSSSLCWKHFGKMPGLTHSPSTPHLQSSAGWTQGLKWVLGEKCHH